MTIEAAAAPAVRYTVRAATVRQDGVAMPVHLVATGGRSALAYGARELQIGARVVLTVDALELTARVAWSDGRRFRLEAAGEEERPWAVLANAPARRRGPADNDAGVQTRHGGHAADHVERAA